jgi:hypothetical protein
LLQRHAGLLLLSQQLALKVFDRAEAANGKPAEFAASELSIAMPVRIDLGDPPLADVEPAKMPDGRANFDDGGTFTAGEDR